MSDSRSKNLTWIIWYIIIPLLIVSLVHQSNILHGLVDYFESGKELACVNELFHGKVLYKEVYSPFGPLNTYLEALTMFLFGKSLVILRGYFYFGTITALMLGYFIGLSLCRYRFFASVIALLLIVETYNPFWATRWGGFRFAFGLLALFCIINFFRKGKGLWAFFAGMSAIIALFVSLDVGLFSFVAIGSGLCFYMMFNFSQDKHLRLKGILFFIIGTLTALAPFLICFILRGSFVPYINTIVTTIQNYHSVWSAGGVPLLKYVKSAKILTLQFKYVLVFVLYAYFGIYLIYRIIKKRTSWKDYAIACLLTYGFLMLKNKVGAERKLVDPHFQVALQPAIILSFVFIDDIFNKIVTLIKRRLTSAGKIVKLVLLIAVFLSVVVYFGFSKKIFYKDFKTWNLYQQHKSYLMPLYTRAIRIPKEKTATLGITRAKGIVTFKEQAYEIENVTKYIISVTEEKEPIFTFPEHGIYNFLANRPCVSKFNIAGFAVLSPKWEQEILTDLKTKNPRYIIYDRSLSNLAKALKRNEEVLPRVTRYIRSNYTRETSFGETNILRRKELQIQTGEENAERSQM